MVETKEMKRFIFDLERGCTDMCYTIKLAYDGKTTEELMGVWNPTPEQIKQIHKEVVEEIKSKLEYEEKEVDYYWMMFLGLTILGVSKKELVTSKSSTNVKKQIAYELCGLDDGDYSTENTLSGVAWCLTNENKSLEKSNICGFYFRHPFGRKRKVHKSLIQNKYIIESGINLQNKEEVERCVDCFCSKLKERMSLIEYTQCLHALTLLGINKSSKKLPEIRSDTNVMYNIAYKLWAFDTSEKNWKIIEQIVCLCSKLNITEGK